MSLERKTGYAPLPVLFLLIVPVLLPACGKEREEEAEKNRPPGQVETRPVSETDVIRNIPEFTPPDSLEHIRSFRKQEQQAVVYTVYYRVTTGVDPILKELESAGLELITRTENGAILSRVRKADGGGRNQLQVLMESFDPDRKIHLGENDLQKKLGERLSADTMLMKVQYRTRSS